MGGSGVRRARVRTGGGKEQAWSCDISLAGKNK